MTTQRRQFLRLLGGVPVSAMGLGALAGCTSPNPNYYQIGASLGRTVTGGPPSVEVRTISIPGYLDRQGIVKSAGDYKLNIHTNDIWSEPLADMLQATLVQNLSQRMPDTTVIGSGGSIGASSDVILETNVMRFDPNPDGTLTLQAQVAVRNGDSLQITVTRTIDESGPADQPLVVNIVASMSKLWGAAADDITALLVHTDAPPPASHRHGQHTRSHRHHRHKSA